MIKYDESEKLLVSELLKVSCGKQKIEVEKIDSVEKLTGDASARRYYRIVGDGKSYVVCLDNPKPEGVEIPTFAEVQAFLLSKNVRVPKIFDQFDDGTYFLEEDLGDLTLLSRLSAVSDYQEELSWYKKAVDLLIAMHSIPNAELKPHAFYKLSFDEAKLTFEYNFTIDYFVNNFLGHCLSARDKECLDVGFKEIIREMAQRPMVFTHRDYHSRNLMVKNGELVVIDFQDARLGLRQYDLVSLLEDCYYQIQENNKEILIDFYLRNSEIKDLNDFMYMYDLSLLQRVFKAIGSFSYIYAKKGDKRYLKYIHYGMEKIKGVLFKYPQLSDVRKALFKIYYAS